MRINYSYDSQYSDSSDSSQKDDYLWSPDDASIQQNQLNLSVFDDDKGTSVANSSRTVFLNRNNSANTLPGNTKKRKNPEQILIPEWIEENFDDNEERMLNEETKAAAPRPPRLVFKITKVVFKITKIVLENLLGRRRGMLSTGRDCKLSIKWFGDKCYNELMDYGCSLLKKLRNWHAGNARKEVWKILKDRLDSIDKASYKEYTKDMKYFIMKVLTEGDIDHLRYLLDVFKTLNYCARHWPSFESEDAKQATVDWGTLIVYRLRQRIDSL